MQSRCKPPKFDEQDWSKFDFSRWHLDGVTRDAATVAIAGMAERLFGSEEWREHFSATLPALEDRAIDVFKKYSLEMREQKKAVAEDFDKRMVAAKQRSDEFRKGIEVSAAPPVIQPSPSTFHVAVKVMAEDVKLGLPGLFVKILHPRDEKVTLAQAITDRDGNAVLTVPEEVAKEMDKSDTTLEVLSPEGQMLLRQSNAVCVRLNQVETKVVTAKDTREIATQKRAALALREEREARGAILSARAQHLREEREATLLDLDCKLTDNDAIIADLEGKGDDVQASGPTGAGEAKPEGEEEPPPDAPKPSRPKKEGGSPPKKDPSKK